MPIRLAKETDSVIMKSLYFINNNRVSIHSVNDLEIVAEIIGFHSSDINNYDSDEDDREPYTVVIRNNGEHTCTCLNFVHAKKEYKQFWGDVAIRSTPECSHVMAIKILPFYKEWILGGDDFISKKAKKEFFLKSFVRTSGTNLPPMSSINLDNIDNPRKKRKINFEQLTK